MNTEVVRPTEDLVTSIQQHLGLPNLWVCLRELGASINENHRRDIRRSLIEFMTEKLKQREFENVDSLSEAMSEIVNLSKLELVPHTSFASISISHCPTMGGYVITPAPHCVGFDLELSSRVSPTLVERISSSDEFVESPDNASLWVAKEASFKALLGPHQPQVISHIQICQWQPLETGLWGFTFYFSNSQFNTEYHGKGCVASVNGLKLSFASKVPDTGSSP